MFNDYSSQKDVLNIHFKVAKHVDNCAQRAVTKSNPRQLEERRGMVTTPVFFNSSFFLTYFRICFLIPLSYSLPHLFGVQRLKTILLSNDSAHKNVECLDWQLPIPYRSQLLDKIEMKFQRLPTRMFSVNSFSIGSLEMLYDQTGSGKSNMAVCKPLNRKYTNLSWYTRDEHNFNDISLYARSCYSM